MAATYSFAQQQPENINVLPMFGKVEKTEAQQLRDQKFLSSCDASFTTRTEASNFFVERGWEYLNEGQTDTAIYRFNLAWLLNPDNSDTYWAFGLITNAQGKPQDAIGFFEKALALKPNNSMMQADLASCYVNLYQQKPKKKTIKTALSYLDKAIATDSQNAFAYYTMAQAKYLTGDYNDAWTYLHKGRELNMTMLDYSQVIKLTEKMPDPQGFFKTGDVPTETE